VGAQEAMPGRGIGSPTQLVWGRRAVLAGNTAGLHTIGKALCADSLANTANGVNAARVHSRDSRVDSRHSTFDIRQSRVGTDADRTWPMSTGCLSWSKGCQQVWQSATVDHERGSPPPRPARCMIHPVHVEARSQRPAHPWQPASAQSPNHGTTEPRNHGTRLCPELRDNRGHRQQSKAGIEAAAQLSH
jgi:hypothetical protein